MAMDLKLALAKFKSIAMDCLVGHQDSGSNSRIRNRVVVS